MHRDGDRWDIEIVGLTSQTAVVAGQVAQVFERTTGRRAPDLDSARGEIPPIEVERGVSHARARRMAAALESAGAVVKLRPSADSEDEIIELEADSQDLDLEPTPIGDLAALAKGLEVAASAELVDLDGGALVPEEAEGLRRSNPDPRPIPRPVRSPSLESPAPRSAQPTDLPLQLDFERARISPLAAGEPRASGLPAVDPKEPGSEGRADTRADTASGRMPMALSPSPSPSAIAGRRYLLGSDRIAAFLWATAIALVVAILPATQVARNHARDVLGPLEGKMAEAVARPLAARAGTIPGPDEVQGELDVAYEDGQRRFLWTWLGVAVPLGLVLGFIPRPGTS